MQAGAFFNMFSTTRNTPHRGLVNYIVDTRVLEGRRKKQRKLLKCVKFDSQYIVKTYKPQGLEKKERKKIKNLGLIAAQCNGIAACAYFIKHIYSTYRYITVPY